MSSSNVESSSKWCWSHHWRKEDNLQAFQRGSRRQTTSPLSHHSPGAQIPQARCSLESQQSRRQVVSFSCTPFSCWACFSKLGSSQSASFGNYLSRPSTPEHFIKFLHVCITRSPSAWCGHPCPVAHYQASGLNECNQGYAHSRLQERSLLCRINSHLLWGCLSWLRGSSSLPQEGTPSQGKENSHLRRRTWDQLSKESWLWLECLFQLSHGQLDSSWASLSSSSSSLQPLLRNLYACIFSLLQMPLFQ